MLQEKKMKTNYTDAGSYDQPNAFHSLRLKSYTKSLIQISSLLRDVCSIISKGCFYLRVWDIWDKAKTNQTVKNYNTLFNFDIMSLQTH